MTSSSIKCTNCGMYDNHRTKHCPFSDIREYLADPPRNVLTTDKYIARFILPENIPYFAVNPSYRGDEQVTKILGYSDGKPTSTVYKSPQRGITVPHFASGMHLRCGAYPNCKYVHLRHICRSCINPDSSHITENCPNLRK